MHEPIPKYNCAQGRIYTGKSIVNETVLLHRAVYKYAIHIVVHLWYRVTRGKRLDCKYLRSRIYVGMLSYKAVQALVVGPTATINLT